MTSVDDLTRGLDQLRDSITQTAHVAPQVARQEIRREGRAYFRGAVVASVIVSLLIGVPLTLLADRFSEHVTVEELRAAQFQATSQDLRRLAQGAHDLGSRRTPNLRAAAWRRSRSPHRGPRRIPRCSAQRP